MLIMLSLNDRYSVYLFLCSVRYSRGKNQRVGCHYFATKEGTLDG